MAMRAFMARGERGAAAAAATAKETAEMEPRPVPPSAPAMRTVAPSTSVDASSEVEGRLRCRETLRIDGRVKGEVECEKAVLVGEGARVYARIAADEVQISGVVEGDIAARRKITLERTAVVKGDLTTPGIVIEEGAKLKGRIVIGSDEEAKAPEAADAAKGEKKRQAAQASGKAPAAGRKPEEKPVERKPEERKPDEAPASRPASAVV
jgi:cytoskeletal protein CcmA (bactofilin family)